MPQNYVVLYPIKAEPIVIQAEQVMESKWHAPWSEPVRQKINPALARALATSGQVYPPAPVVPFGYYRPLSEPVRLPKGLKAPYQREFFTDNLPLPSPGTLVRWLLPFGVPVWPKKGIGAALQPAYVGPPRAIPTPNISGRMYAVETNNDIFTGAVNVYSSVPSPTSGAGARVSIQEIVVPPQSPVSIRET